MTTHGSSPREIELRDARDPDSKRADLQVGIGVSLVSFLWLTAFAQASPFSADPPGWLGPIAASLLSGIFYSFQRALGTGPRSALLCASLLTTASYLAVASVHAPEQVVAALFVFAALFAFHSFRNSGGLLALALGGLLSGVCAILPMPTMAAAPVLFAYGATCSIARYRETPTGVSWAILLACSGIAPTVVISDALQLIQLPWLHPWTSNPSEFTGPILSGLHRFVLSPGAGILAYTPLLLLAPCALASRGSGAPAPTSWLLAISFVLIIGCSLLDPATEVWAAPGPRHLVSLCALLLLPLGGWLEGSRSRVAWGSVFALGFISVCGQVVLMTASWPAVIETMGYRDFSSPADFVFIPHTIPLLGAIQLAATGGIKSWSWLLIGSAMEIACFSFASVAGISWLARAVRRHPGAR